MEAALWSAVALVAAISTSTLFVLITRLDGLSARIDGLGGQTSARLDGLSARIDGLGARIDTGLDGLSARIDGLSADMNAAFDRVDDRLTRVEGRLAGVERDLHTHISRDAG